MFIANKYYLKPLDEDAATELPTEIFQRANDHLDPSERDYILAQAGRPSRFDRSGGARRHAGGIWRARRPIPSRRSRMAGDVLQNHLLVRGELGKLWKQLLPDEREAAA